MISPSRTGDHAGLVDELAYTHVGIVSPHSSPATAQADGRIANRPEVPFVCV